MSLTSPGRALRRFSLLSISLKLLTLSGIRLFSINLFWLASFFALLVGLNLSFLIGALAWFFKITKAAHFKSVEVFRKDSFLALYFSFSSLMIFRLLCLLPSAALFMLMIWPFSPPPPRFPTAVEATQEALFRLERWSEYWCLPLNPSKCEASFSVDLHLKLLLLGSHLRFKTFNPTSTFLGVTFNCTLSFSKHVSLLKAKFFRRLKALRSISASSWGPRRESLSLLYKAFFLAPSHASPRWFPFLSATNITKLECLHRVASCAITGCLSSSPIPLFLSEACLPSLRVTLTHFTLLSYEWTFRLPTSFPYLRFAQTRSETKALQIVLESFCVYSPAHASSHFF